MNRIYDLYKAVEPIAELTEKNKAKIDIIISEIEDDESVSDKQWIVVEEIKSLLLNLSYSGGDTSINILKESVELITENDA